jgi:hypothetical protein
MIETDSHQVQQDPQAHEHNGAWRARRSPCFCASGS